ncbi:MAG: lytic transglycosylase domain-containing protein [Eubacterium sp.]|nr:lytic transglycosylase domain-containing protein [Eubacterium sp.]
MVVTDVTGTPATGTAAYTPIGSVPEESQVTPFREVLKKASSQKATESVSDAPVHVKKSTEGSGGGSAETTVKLDDVFKKASEKYDISYDFLVAVAKAESDFDYNCVSSAGAKGIMQLMPDEVKEFGVTNVFDPEQNIMAAAKLLAAHLKKFDGNFTLAAAAYNAGSGAVQKYGGVPPYTETQNYVKRIARFMEEGVTVPDKDVKVSSDYSESDGGSTGVTNSEQFDEGTPATDEDWDQVRITVGTGDQAVTMTYGAYQKYKELGSLGVG